MTGWRIVEGDALTRLRELDAGSVQTCVTSPPYFGLRDYGTGSWEGGDEGCQHSPERAERNTRPRGGLTGGLAHVGAQDAGALAAAVCSCGARRVDSQIGLEPTPDEYVQALVEVFREVRRVLRDDGTVWLNLGDSYNAYNGNRGTQSPYAGNRDRVGEPSFPQGHGLGVKGLKPKDLLGIPWMVAFALRADGWYLRSDIIWSKPNPMPESVTDRPTKAHEYVFLLSKSKSYFYDADAVREQWADERNGVSGATLAPIPDRQDGGCTQPPQVSGRNKRSVWTVATQPYAGCHFAVFPAKLIEPCVLAGSAERACGVCGAPWERVVERTSAEVLSPNSRYDESAGRNPAGRNCSMLVGASAHTLGFEPSCDHQDGTDSSVVLDPFAGAGTTGLVATRHGRGFVGIELNPEYAEMARERIRDDAPLMNYITEVEDAA